MSLLEKLKKIDSDVGVTADHDRDHEGKVSYLQTQVEEIKSIMWRLRTDILLNGEIEPSSEDEATAQDTKVREMKRDLKRMARAVDVNNALLEELKASK